MALYGICHLCMSPRMIDPCSICKHWLCDECRADVFGRAGAALKEMAGMGRDGCCGPFDVLVTTVTEH